MLTSEDFQAIISNISLPFPTWTLNLEHDGERLFMQVEDKCGIDNFTGEELPWKGRKWMLSPHMCVSEVVRTAHKAVMAAVEHEMDEKFRYKGVSIYDPHTNVDLLVALDEKIRVDSRENRVTRVPERK